MPFFQPRYCSSDKIKQVQITVVQQYNFQLEKCPPFQVFKMFSPISQKISVQDKISQNVPNLFKQKRYSKKLNPFKFPQNTIYKNTTHKQGKYIIYLIQNKVYLGIAEAIEIQLIFSLKNHNTQRSLYKKQRDKKRAKKRDIYNWITLKAQNNQKIQRHYIQYKKQHLQTVDYHYIFIRGNNITILELTFLVNFTSYVPFKKFQNIKNSKITIV
eukprot:TRINITY_DN2700_c0_g1_i4.p1 TRINITY_DN2700_c0_g1~~TRINITY_DN2700_c0_g1_i4.p1  ORF type:complete len:214 (-),score=-11.04 TRINITY_DN2700_c0_g1_i4:481-1122(-)